MVIATWTGSYPNLCFGEWRLTIDAAALGAVMQKKPESVLALAGCSVACALVGSVAFRCLMWVCTSSVANYFGQI